MQKKSAGCRNLIGVRGSAEDDAAKIWSRLVVGLLSYFQKPVLRRWLSLYGEVKEKLKEKDEELKGISKDVLDERGKDQCCLKCGKSGHKWFEFWCKAPVTTKSAAGYKRGNDGSGGGAAKQGKTAGAKAEETATAASGWVIEILEMAEEDLDLWAL